MADLTTLAAVKSYLAVTGTNVDQRISELIARESRMIEQYCGRIFPSVTRTNKRLNGTGTNKLVLPDNPILSVAALTIDGVVMTPSTDGLTGGYLIDDMRLVLVGGQKFTRGSMNVMATWTAGFRSSQTSFIDATKTITPTTDGSAGIDHGVVYAASGAPLTLVGANASVGQYSFANGSYSFNATDVGQQVTMTYDYIPAPVEQACIEMIGLDLKQRDNLGINSKTLAGETITYSQVGMTPSMMQQLQAFKRYYPA
jgi:hypothetical protein